MGRWEMDMALDTRELFARLIQCEAGGEGTAGMQAVATVIMNRATTTVGEFARVNNGGDVRAIITHIHSQGSSCACGKRSAAATTHRTSTT